MNIIENDIKNKAFRHQLIERYLDADTSIEEEKALSAFYRHADKETLTEEDIDIRNIMLGVEISANGSMANEAIGNEATDSHNQSNLWVRFSAILLAAAMLTGLIFLAFPIKHQEKLNFAALTPASTTIHSQQNSTEDREEAMVPFTRMEQADSAFLADTKCIVISKTRDDIATSSKSHSTNLLSTADTRKNIIYGEQGTTETEVEAEAETEANFEAGNHYYEVYEVASVALPTAEQLKIDKQDGRLVITAIDDAGNLQDYTVNTDEAQDGTYQFHPLAQLEELSDF